MDNNLRPFSYREPDLIIDNIFDFEDFSEIPEKSGAYIITSHKQKFTYPNGVSKIIYIGKSSNLKRRIQTHKRVVLEIKNLRKDERNSYWYYSRYQYIAKFGGKVYLFTTRGKQDEKNLENKLIENFYDRYFALPVGNGAISYRKETLTT